MISSATQEHSKPYLLVSTWGEEACSGAFVHVYDTEIMQHSKAQVHAPSLHVFSIHTTCRPDRL